MRRRDLDDRKRRALDDDQRRRQRELLQDVLDADDQPRRDSMRTLFEFRARAWIAAGFLSLALGVLAYLITRSLVQ